MEDQDQLFVTLQEFIDGVQKEFESGAEYSIELKRNMLKVAADFFEGAFVHTHTYRVKLTKEQVSEVRQNLADSQENFEAWYFPTPRVHLEKLLKSSLRKEIIDAVLLTI